MKTKNVKNNNPIDENGYPKPKQTKCWKCQKEFWLKFVVPQQNYSQKNYWIYWTEKKEDQEKFICSPCLREFYYNKSIYLETIKDLKKKRILSSYVSSNSI